MRIIDLFPPVCEKSLSPIQDIARSLEALLQNVSWNERAIKRRLSLNILLPKLLRGWCDCSTTL
ncbi:hypothetical protein [Calothrix sp. NIES-2098]|uniref:hypothetical protein n=1 Tax=Calothrix sp. NIES-2098 TaxID=1954171 RepID=UPI0030DC6AFF